MTDQPVNDSSTVIDIPPPPKMPRGRKMELADDREPRRRPHGFFFDRIKVTLVIAVYFLITVSYEQSQIPLMSWSDAFRDQSRAKWWLWIIAGVEVLRQLHYIVSEFAGGYHTFWRRRIWGGWDRLMGRLKPYTRFRLARLVKRIIVITLLGVVLSW